MSLLKEAMEECLLYEKIRTPDGEGGFGQTIWTEGAAFLAAITFNSSMEARIAEKQGVTGLYTVTTHKNVTLNYHDVFKRLRDGKIFRVLSDGDDNYTPKSSTLNMRQVEAEEYILS